MDHIEKNIFKEGQVLLFDKPLYWTSFDLVNKVRILLKSTFGEGSIKVGHAGTLDPLASGLMIICTGKATKRIEEFRDMDKEYVATIHLGETTPSFDLETQVDMHYPTDHITRRMIEKELKGFIGEQYQMPPIYSAKFIEGKRAYEYARKGLKKDLKPVKVVFRDIKLLDFDMPELQIRLLCSKGTYIRSFASDLGKALRSGAYLSALQRSAIGTYRLEQAFNLEKFELFLQQMKLS
jgi:tRNA pseudouridine55 synthase